MKYIGKEGRIEEGKEERRENGKDSRKKGKGINK